MKWKVQYVLTEPSFKVLIKNHNFVHVDPELHPEKKSDFVQFVYAQWGKVLCFWGNTVTFTQNIHFIYVHFSAELKLDDPVSVSVDLLHLKN